MAGIQRIDVVALVEASLDAFEREGVIDQKVYRAIRGIIESMVPDNTLMSEQEARQATHICASPTTNPIGRFANKARVWIAAIRRTNPDGIATAAYDMSYFTTLLRYVESRDSNWAARVAG